jgi:hypothetical protein
MDDEMIDRCAKALITEYKVNNSFKGMTIAVIKAMREPTEKMQEAGNDVGPDRSPSEYWEAMIDAITNDQ